MEKKQVELIDQIIEKRHKEAEVIKNKIDHLSALKKELESYQALRDSIVDSNGNLINGNPCEQILSQHPEMVRCIVDADSKVLTHKIDDYLRELSRLHKRFIRPNIAIQIFGLAGNGKSRFIQTVTGLDNNTILTSDGDHCTGATTYIENSENFYAHIYPYTEAEIVNIFNTILSKISTTIPSVNNLDEIKNFDYEKYGLTHPAISKSVLPLHYYSDDIDEIRTVIGDAHSSGQNDEQCGRKYLNITNQEEVQPYVAQHNGGTGKNKQVYKKFKAVKYVRLGNKFPVGDSARLELIDTVGLGDSNTQLLVLQNMYESIAENSDIVIQLYHPIYGRSIQFDDSCNCLNNIHYLNSETERIPNECLCFVFNEYNKNSPSEDAYKGYIKDLLNKWQKQNRHEPFVFADCSDKNDVKSKVLVPILNSVIQNLSNIDQKKSEEVLVIGESLYQDYQQFISNVSNVLLAPAQGMIIQNLIGNVNTLIDQHLHNGFADVIADAKDSKLCPTADLRMRIDGLCQTNTCNTLLENIQSIFDEGNRLNQLEALVYANASRKLRQLIPDLFRSIDTDLQQHVIISKARIFKTLYTAGRFSAILKINKEETDEQLIEWAHRFKDLILDSVNYPHLHHQFANLLTFTINIEEFMLYRAVRPLQYFDDPIDPSPANSAQEDIVENVKIQISSKIQWILGEIKNDMMKFIQDPNDAIYFAVAEFQNNILFDPDCRKELETLYFTFKENVWRKDFEQEVNKNIAFEVWSNARKKLEEFNKQTNF